MLLGFFRWQNVDGELPGGYSPSKPKTPSHGTAPFPACLGGTPVCKNNAETDQESSVVQATRRYYDAVGDAIGLPFLETVVDGVPVVGRLELALEWLVLKRLDAATGLLWGATTLDWGDVQPYAHLRTSFDHLWGMSGRVATPHTPCTALYLVAMLVGC